MLVEVARTDLGHGASANAQPSRCAPANFLMLGIGNVLLGDEGVGVRLVERLHRDPEFQGIDFVDGGTLSFSLLGLIESVDALMVADAAELGEAPGTVRVFEDDDMDRFLRGSRRRSVHEVGLCDLLDMARLSDCLPSRRALVCVQPQTIGWSDRLSPVVADALDVAASQAATVLRNWRRTS